MIDIGAKNHRGPARPAHGHFDVRAVLRLCEELADDYLVMERGEVIAHGPGSEMKAKNIKQLVSI
jgi:hypothetical protein